MAREGAPSLSRMPPQATSGNVREREEPPQGFNHRTC
jgi:hypothetical protein